MLKRYLTLQQDSLSRLGEERQRLREQAEREEQRALRLQGVLGELARPPDQPHPLLWQNQQQMGQQVRRLFEHQVQQSALARLELERHEAVLRHQFGRVKGLEQLISRREEGSRLREAQGVQRQLDELATQRFLRRE
ncbi:flagellar protein [Aeromonas schubertii]|uniref:Flagellar protein n=1 Tax=Aeromonas schubertii TaxID=652 RepID=A0ABS7VCJ0_9GAMM|nr:flagellar protein [Aeromonas schubertii]MBZ6067097.1 flagellar protein [Aeromonas schubertii]